ncbi:hypothetical protein [Microbulbifer hydrolyticus]|uniref:Uncharacterized protein n=1 Tax=Microbulbifer hydrolyticus TaxID=48074 RepID=A0A6P1T801_9GAMM|nr:hypothetical protein [Microbulbifer hydrolyticus]MBB5210640.1 hypothetical protein [Microbulbifer hydrolyticus]QHQ38898.1 hypothetical protein GTQ55_07805 [Microbulbifer hydrolyticus]
MIVFTLTNEDTDEVWVGTAREGVTPEARFQQIQAALTLGIDHPFYQELKKFGAGAFTPSLFAVAEDRLELQELVEEALDSFNAKSLVGIKTVRPGTTKSALSPKPKPRASRAKTSTGAKATVSKTAKPVKEKLATGRTGSAARERAIKAGIEAEKARMAAAKAKKVQDEADEMRAILAGLDARGSTLSRR